MKVALANPPWLRPGHYGTRAGSRWPHFEENGSRYMPYPFYLGYTASLLENDGFEAAVFDGCATKEANEKYLKRILAFGPDIVIQENATASIDVDLRWAETLKAKTGATLLMTGHHVGFMQNDLAKYPAIDALAGGEWEFTALELCQRVRDGKSFGGILGLSHKTKSGDVVHEERRPNITDLDGLPFPHRRTLDMNLYHDNPGDIPSPSLQLHGSRGCPYKCNFCVWPQVVYEDNKYRTRSGKSMADEIEAMFRNDPFPYRSYYFDDDTFNIGDRRLSDLADELIMRGLEHIPWGAMCRADTLKKETLAKLRKGGLAAVKYGVENGDQKIVNDSGKNLDLMKLRDMMKFTHGLGIKTHLTFSFGLIGETKETMQKTLDLALELNPYTVQFSISTPFPGTRFYDYADQKGLLVTKDFSAYDGMSRSIVRADAVTADELEEFLAHAYDEWHRHEARRSDMLHRVLKDPISSAKLAMKNPRRAFQYAVGRLTKGRSSGVNDGNRPTAV
jgi:radical SAM superfamily enzyme YgiQ (UPF0313 family)